MSIDRPRRPSDPHAAAEAVFKKPVAPKIALAPKSSAIPTSREVVSLRIDQDILEHFQEGGPGWQDRINEALRQIVRAAG